MCIGAQLRWFLICAWECRWGSEPVLHGSALMSDLSTLACMGVHWGQIYQPGLAWECIEVRFINLGLHGSALRSDLSTWACMGVHWGQIYQPGLAWECSCSKRDEVTHDVSGGNVALRGNAVGAGALLSLNTTCNKTKGFWCRLCLEMTCPSEGTLLVLMLCALLCCRFASPPTSAPTWRTCYATCCRWTWQNALATSRMVSMTSRATSGSPPQTGLPSTRERSVHTILWFYVSLLKGTPSKGAS